MNQQYTYPTNSSNYNIQPTVRNSNSSNSWTNSPNNMIPKNNINTISPSKKSKIKYLAFYTTMNTIYFIRKIKKRFMNRKQR